MKKFTIIKTPTTLTPFSEREEIASGSLSLFEHVRIPVEGDYLYLGEDLGVFQVDWILFEVDSGNVVIAVTFDWREVKDKTLEEKEKEEKEWDQKGSWISELEPYSS